MPDKAALTATDVLMLRRCVEEVGDDDIVVANLPGDDIALTLAILAGFSWIGEELREGTAALLAGDVAAVVDAIWDAVGILAALALIAVVLVPLGYTEYVASQVERGRPVNSPHQRLVAAWARLAPTLRTRLWGYTSHASDPPLPAPATLLIESLNHSKPDRRRQRRARVLELLS